jgi:uncharacterized repeat protein (TIGR01451 family)
MLILSAAGAPLARSVQAAGPQPTGPAPKSVDTALLVANKSVSQAQALWSDTLTYTITLTNTMVLTPLTALMTDTLPVSLAFQPGSLSASEGAVTHTAQVINWSGIISPGSAVTISLQAQVILPNITITNVAVADAGSNGLYVSPAATTVVGPIRVFLPVLYRPQPGISGRVNFNGSPAAGVQLELRFFNGTAFSTIASQSTGGDGSYLFSPPALLPGQKYYVRFTNLSNTSQLYRWYTRELTAYQPGDSVPIGDFDVANIELSSPAPGATIGLPFNFQWNVRPATPSDSYEFDLFSLTAATPYFFTDPPLGYVGGYILTTLPPGFSTGTQYGWDAWVHSPDGGQGTSYWYYYVAFSNSGAAQPSALSLGQMRTADLPAQLIDPK